MNFDILIDDYEKLFKPAHYRTIFTLSLLNYFLSFFGFFSVSGTVLFSSLPSILWYFIGFDAFFLIVCGGICITISVFNGDFKNSSCRDAKLEESNKRTNAVIKLLNDAGIDIKNKTALDLLINELNEKVKNSTIDAVKFGTIASKIVSVIVLILTLVHNTLLNKLTTTNMLIFIIYSTLIIIFIYIFFLYLAFIGKKFDNLINSTVKSFISDLKQIIVFHNFCES